MLSSDWLTVNLNHIIICEVTLVMLVNAILIESFDDKSMMPVVHPQQFWSRFPSGEISLVRCAKFNSHWIADNKSDNN